ncbi:hypothetical protein Igag_0120 [Ignisphaera aggregans DSM 17230]|uniref:Uncharacterized protein n=1 Tax=Ignisphaera aggregans (strain DSM 17230 / JCM 13409 / AQ1.S1) TaxID=583356 RepID=E0SPV0_IGNAA|nr:hypothetical protein Igag_0120 [Ignisphaera aggregans DSM 17230]
MSLFSSRVVVYVLIAVMLLSTVFNVAPNGYGFNVNSAEHIIIYENFDDQNVSDINATLLAHASIAEIDTGNYVLLLYSAGASDRGGAIEIPVRIDKYMEINFTAHFANPDGIYVFLSPYPVDDLINRCPSCAWEDYSDRRILTIGFDVYENRIKIDGREATSYLFNTSSPSTVSIKIRTPIIYIYIDGELVAIAVHNFSITKGYLVIGGRVGGGTSGNDCWIDDLKIYISSYTPQIPLYKPVDSSAVTLGVRWNFTIDIDALYGICIAGDYLIAVGHTANHDVIAVLNKTSGDPVNIKLAYHQYTGDEYSPYGFIECIYASGYIYVLSSSGAIVVFDLQLTKVNEVWTGLTFPESSTDSHIVFDGYYLYVMGWEQSSNTILKVLKYGISGASLNLVTSYSYGNSYLGVGTIEVNYVSNSIWIATINADQTENIIVVLDKDLNPINVIRIPSTDGLFIGTPKAVTHSDDGDVYVAGSRGLIRIDTSGRITKLIDKDVCFLHYAADLYIGIYSADHKTHLLALYDGTSVLYVTDQNGYLVGAGPMLSDLLTIYVAVAPSAGGGSKMIVALNRYRYGCGFTFELKSDAGIMKITVEKERIYSTETFLLIDHPNDTIDFRKFEGAITLIVRNTPPEFSVSSAEYGYRRYKVPISVPPNALTYFITSDDLNRDPRYSNFELYIAYVNNSLYVYYLYGSGNYRHEYRFVFLDREYMYRKEPGAEIYSKENEDFVPVLSFTYNCPSCVPCYMESVAAPCINCLNIVFSSQYLQAYVQLKGGAAVSGNATLLTVDYGDGVDYSEYSNYSVLIVKDVPDTFTVHSPTYGVRTYRVPLPQSRNIVTYFVAIDDGSAEDPYPDLELYIAFTRSRIYIYLLYDHGESFHSVNFICDNYSYSYYKPSNATLYNNGVPAMTFEIPATCPLEMCPATTVTLTTTTAIRATVTTTITTTAITTTTTTVEKTITTTMTYTSSYTTTVTIESPTTITTITTSTAIITTESLWSWILIIILLIALMICIIACRKQCRKSKKREEKQEEK